MQRDLAANLAELTGLEVISFRHIDCLVLSRGEVLKLFMPRSQRTLLGTSKDRSISGDIIAICADAIKPLKPPSKRFDYTDLVFGAPLANFPGLTMYQEGEKFVDSEDFFNNLKTLASFLPNSVDGWREAFGSGFLEKPLLERISKGIDFLRSSTDFSDKIPDPANFTISIDEPWD